MPKTSSQQPLSKRQAMKQQHIVKARRERWITIGIIVAVVAILIAVMVIPQIRTPSSYVGEFVQITPDNYPNTNGLTMGDPTAPVKIEVFSDFHCTACAAYSESVEPLVISEILQAGNVYYVDRQYPFMDDNYEVKDSDMAASAAYCAGEQNRFFDYKKMLFANMNSIVGEFSQIRLIAFAEALGLDKELFTTCMEENRYAADIQTDISLAEQYAVTGTPSVFVNGQSVSPGYVPTLELIKEAVQAALALANQ